MGTPKVDPKTTEPTTAEPDFIFDVQYETDTTSDADFFVHVDPAFKPNNVSAAKPAVEPSLQPAIEPSARSLEWYFG